jgi:nicotinate-nucleotide adenylyltransferase
VLGGTFAPIHNGHLRLATEARDQLGLSEVRLIPAALPPLRAAPAISAERRLRWVELAIRSEKKLVADGRELRRPGPSYTVDTLAELRAEQPLAPLCLLLGQDAARQLPQWHRWQTLPQYAHLVFFNRPGQARALPAELNDLLQDRQARAVQELHRQPAGLWWRCEMPPMDISASGIRARLRKRLSVQGLVPQAVIEDFTQTDLEAFALNEEETPADR